MSGAKAVVITPMFLPVISAALVAAAVAGAVSAAELTRRYILFRKTQSKYARMAGDVEILLRRLFDLTGERVERSDQTWALSAEDAFQAAELSNAIGCYQGAVRELEAVQTQVGQALEKRICALQQRTLDFATRVHDLRERRERLREALQALDAGHDRVQLEGRLEAVSLPSIPEIELAGFERTSLDQAENAATEAENQLAALEVSLEQTIGAHHRAQMTTRLSAAKDSRTLADFLEKQPVTAAGAEDKAFREKIDGLLGQIGVLEETGAWTDLMKRVNTARFDGNPQRRRLLYQDLVLDCSRQLKELKSARRWREDVDRLLEEAAVYVGTAVDATIEELVQIRRAGRPVELQPYRDRLARVQASELERLERERRRQAVLESLRELGYETNEGLETALVQAGRVIVQKPDQKEYAVEVVANSDLSVWQTSLVRFADESGSGADQRRRDFEHEEKWCEDHAAWRALLKQKGLDIQFKLKLPAGEHPVKVIVEKNKPRRAAAPIARARGVSS